MNKYTLLCIIGSMLSSLSGKHHKGEMSPIFDGKTLNGWSQLNGTASYRVQDGAIIGKTMEGSPNSFLCTNKLYGDFELKFEVKLINNELNSGVQIRSNTKELAEKEKERGDKFGRVNGPQVEIEATKDKGAESGYVYGEACGGWMTPKDKLVPHNHFKNGEWNQYKIVAKGPRIQTWVNGNKVSNLTDKEKFQSHPKGFIGLQVHSIKKGSGPFEVAWRNIKIKVM
ncbi:MAG: hypothetical protein CBC20_00840 [Verrucomicrobia bacterium TMED60]|jgi:hypothetical protein|nr:MAG: hypothetical protein CBC20_00840 [Verrucomicrobia bacterium TMED60]